MPLQSMTGFARSEAVSGRLRFVWEMRSVNGKGLDLRLRLPPGFDRLETEIRARLAERFNRGNVQLSLSVSGERAAAVPVVNAEALAIVLSFAEVLKTKIDATPPSIDGLLAIKGVVDLKEPEDSEEDQAAFASAAMAALDRGIADLVEARASEGAALRSILEGHLSTIETLANTIDADPSRSPANIRQRLEAQVAQLTSAGNLDPERLHMEAVLLAAKADLREELDRLQAHVAAGRELLSKGGPIGRRLDFLAQEFNREANTICSKSNAASVTANGMELKVVIDQLREQVQNIE
ncbi:YicC/YloC family endoribonuclease [Rhizobium sp. EC-SD404]|uniref:YicC/YloC family endoribonuclease n=1 Tax=Rhizobium sp. EC-SD404 TaxID=2038389 RepID=UPI00125FA8A4|nr:YicC/YloC family endoribonuclease [Rhizobium sp. EC-SD404]